MSISNEVRYLASHEWGRIDEEGILTVGISEHAQDLLGDIVFVELPEIGKALDAEEESAIVESVKAASDVYSPMSGEVIEINVPRKHKRKLKKLSGNNQFGLGFYE